MGANLGNYRFIAADVTNKASLQNALVCSEAELDMLCLPNRFSTNTYEGEVKNKYFYIYVEKN